MMRDSEPNFSIGRQSSEVDRQAQLLLELQRRLGMQGPYVGAQARISAHLYATFTLSDCFVCHAGLRCPQGNRCSLTCTGAAANSVAISRGPCGSCVRELVGLNLCLGPKRAICL